MRNTIEVAIGEGRDAGKTFVLTEMSPMRAEKWACRALCAIINAGIDVPEELRGSGMAGIAAIGVHQILNFRFAEFEPLLDEMMGCVRFKMGGSSAPPPRALIEDDIDEVSTILKLRREVLLLHVGFLPAAVRSKWISMLIPAASGNIRTSPAPLE